MTVPLWQWWTDIILFSLGLIIALIITIMHSKNVYSELKSRKKDLPKTHKLLSFTIISSLISFFVAVLSPLLNFTVPFNSCQFYVIILAWPYPFAKMFMYLAFIIRLYAVYNNPLYHYNLLTLKTISIIIIIWAISLYIYMIPTSKAHTISGPDSINICILEPNLIAGAMALLYDIVFNIGLMIAFINPLRKLIKFILNSKSEENSKVTEKQKQELKPLITTSIKYVVLTTVAFLTTLLSIIVWSAGYTFAAPFDYIVNMICIILMTSYYEKQRYFQRLCCGGIRCIYCCMGCCCGYNENVEIMMEVNAVTVSEASNGQTATGQENTSKTPELEMSI